MADEWLRYLRQQMELGGEEVILPAPLGAGAAGERVSAPADTPAPDPADRARAPEEDDMPRKKAGPGGRGASHEEAAPAGAPAKGEQGGADWRAGAPPIPEAGLAVDPPPLELLEPGIATLPTLDAVAEKIRSELHCPLCPGRTHAVPGEGDPKARLVVVGEGPGATEDQTGRPFVGAAGKLLEKMLGAIGISRESVFITNIVKCRPPQNRKPLPDEVAACIPFLHRQLALIRPRVILCLGGTAGESLLGAKKSLGQLRGKVHTYAGIPLIVTYHPAALLRNPNWKKPTWDDLRIAGQLLER